MNDDTRPRGRPVEYPYPEPVPDTPENIARALMETPPKEPHEWKFMRHAPNVAGAAGLVFLDILES